jgi:hypothetical protein
MHNSQLAGHNLAYFSRPAPDYGAAVTATGVDAGE